MAEVLEYGLIIPSGGDYIDDTGVQPTRTLGASMVAALRGIETAYDIAVKAGYDGTVEEWLASLIGPPGEEGPYGGTAVTDPQVEELVTAPSLTHAALENAYRHSASVSEYGAVGDGVTDDTVAIQSALDAVTPSGAVRVPDGVFVVGAITIPDGVAMVGTGKSTLRVMDGAGGTVVHLAGAGASLAGMQIDGNSAGQTVTWQVLVRISGEACQVTGVRVWDSLHKVFVLAPTAQHTVVSGCILSGNGLLDNCNAFEIQCSYVTFSDCHIYDHGNGHAFRVGNTPESAPGYITFTGCIVERTQHNAWTLEIASEYVTIANCIARDVPQAVKADESAHHITVESCTFDNIHLSTAFNLATATDCIVSGVRLSNSANGLIVGENALVTGCSVENIHSPLGNPTRGIYVKSGIVADCKVENVSGGGIYSGGGSIRGCIVVDCGKADTQYVVLMQPSASSTGSNMIGNVVRNPGNTEHPTATAFGLYGGNSVVQANILDGPIARGIRVVDGFDNYIITDNIVGSAATPILQGNGASRIVEGNL